VLNQIVPWIWHVVIDVTCCQEERTWCCAQEAAPRGQLLIKCEFLIYQKNLSLSACMDITQYNLIIRSLLFEICTITCGHSSHICCGRVKNYHCGSNIHTADAFPVWYNEKMHNSYLSFLFHKSNDINFLP
jgi:hypothetical protein